MAWTRTIRNRKAGNPYGAKKQVFAGRSFDSGLEKKLFLHLETLRMAGEIVEIEQQKTLYLTDARIGYRTDFLVTKTDGTKEAHEAKGFETEPWKIKKRLYKVYGEFTLHVWKSAGKGIRLDETIIPAPAKQVDISR